MKAHRVQDPLDRYLARGELDQLEIERRDADATREAAPTRALAYRFIVVERGAVASVKVPDEVKQLLRH